MSDKQGKKGGGNRKHGRNRAFCQTYAATRRREANRARRMLRTLRSQPGNELLRNRIHALVVNDDPRPFKNYAAQYGFNFHSL